MTVNVGTIGHVDLALRTLAAGRRNTKLSTALAVALAHCGGVPELPKPKPAKRLTAADLERIHAAEAKRQRRLERNKQRGEKE